MSQAKPNDSVEVHYTGRLEDGTVFDSSEGREPLAFTIGQGQMIPGFEQGVMGMQEGESKTIHIPSDQAYGPHVQEMVMTVPKTQLPPDLNPEVGQQLQATQPNGQPLILTVMDVTEDSVTLDANHPLAGKDLTFDIRLVKLSS